jgi:hypothetical protein
VEQVARDQATPAKKFLFEMIFGLCVSGSTLLTEVGRKLPSQISLHAVEKRFSRQLGSRRWDSEAMLRRYIQWAARIIKPDTVLALDTSDIRKLYAEMMECLGKVHDGSMGEIATGYWLLAIEAHQASGHRQGIYGHGAPRQKSSSRRTARSCAPWRCRKGRASACLVGH